jgi:predicted DNA-binding transcriptional regulator AlpA
MKELLLDAEQVARRYPVGRGWLYDRVRAGDIQYYKIGKQFVRVEPSMVEEWLRSHGRGEAE